MVKVVVTPCWVCLLTTFIFPVSHAYAVQTHGGAEGLVSHQLGHFLFTFAILVLLFCWNRSHVTKPGCQEFRGFLWMIVVWNVLTFAGHWMGEMVEPQYLFDPEGRITSFQINRFSDLIFYLTRLDYLLLVPAFFLLFLAIQKWGRTS